MFDRKKSDALFMETLDILDMLNTRDGRFEYADYVTLHNNITALYDSFADVDGALQETQPLKKAKAEGRLVVLPCKVGDTIFTICWNIKNQKYEVCTGKVKNVRCDAADGSVMVSDGEHFRIWGKTVFLTREAAEKALDKLLKNDEGREKDEN